MAVANNPVATSATYTQSYVSTFNIHKPHYQNFLFRKYGKQGLPFFLLVSLLGFVTPVDAMEWKHFEEDWIHATFLDSAGTAAAVQKDITLAATDIDAVGSTFYPQVGDEVIFPDQTVGVITIAGTAPLAANQIRVRSHTGTVLPLTAASQELVIYSSNFPEGTDQPNGRVSKPLEYTYNGKIMKQTVKMTGSEMTNRAWVEKDSDGNPINAWCLKGQLDIDYRMMLNIDGAALFDQPITDATLVAAGYRAMTGLVPFVRGGGNVGGYTPGLLTMSNFDLMVRRLDRQQAPSEFAGFLGINLHLELENLFVDFFNQNPIIFAGGQARSMNEFQFGEVAPEVSKLGINVGFQQLNKGGRIFNFFRLAQLNHPKLYGATGYNMNGMGIFCPLDKPKEPSTGAKIPRIGMRYKELNGYSRKMETWVTGGAGNIQKTSGEDSQSVHQRCEMGTEFFGSNAFYLLEES